MMWAGGIVSAVVLSAALTPLPIVVTALIGIIAMVLSGCINKDDIYSGVSWDVIFLLAGVIPLGIAILTYFSSKVPEELALEITREIAQTRFQEEEHVEIILKIRNNSKNDAR